MEKVNLQDARNKGHKFYFTGNPCKYGHIVKRRVSNRNCVECERILGRTDNHQKHSKNSLNKKITRAFVIYGGKCQMCDVDEWLLLDFHHRDGRKNHKNDDIKKAVTQIVKSNKILKRFVLLCCNCHRKQDLVDGTGKIGIRNQSLQKAYRAKKHSK